MKYIIVILVCLLLIPLVSAHAIEKGPISKSTEDYIIEFSTEPKFPVTGKDTHLDFIITDEKGGLLSGLDVKIELHKEEKDITLNLSEEEKAHYSIEYNFIEAGEYKIHLVIDDKALKNSEEFFGRQKSERFFSELETDFDLEIDSFGASGLLKVGVIVILLSILIGLMYKDCRRRKNGQESSNFKNT